jgi:hypothetical protein
MRNNVYKLVKKKIHTDVEIDNNLPAGTYVFIADVNGETSFCVDLINKNGISDTKNNENIAKFIIEKMERAYWQGYFTCMDKYQR